jgi:hypothetical protein
MIPEKLRFNAGIHHEKNYNFKITTRSRIALR